MRPVKALANADEVVRLLAEEGELSPAEISERLGIPRPSVYRLLDGLSSIGLTEPIRKSSARLGLRWLHLADRARASIVEWSEVHEPLAALVDATEQTAYFSVLRGFEAVCIAWEPGRGIGVLALRPGRKLPLHAGAAGRALLATSANIDAYLASGGRRGYTERTLLSDEDLRRDATETRARGYALSVGDVTDGISAIGVPVPGAAVPAALSLAGLSAEFAEREAEFAEAVRRTAREISERSE